MRIISSVAIEGSPDIAVTGLQMRSQPDQIDEAVIHAEVDRDFRIAGEKIGQRRRQMQEAETHGGADAQPPARRRLQLADREIGFFKIGQNAYRTLEVAAPRLGQSERARRAVKQADAELGFQRADIAADR